MNIVPTSARHILSTAKAHTPVQVEYLVAVRSDFLKPRVKNSMTKAPVIWPKPCMENTAPIMAPRHLVVANLHSYQYSNCLNTIEETNSDVIIEDSG
jgi:hypothetical protein